MTGQQRGGCSLDSLFWKPAELHDVPPEESPCLQLRNIFQDSTPYFVHQIGLDFDALSLIAVSQLQGVGEVSNHQQPIGLSGSDLPKGGCGPGKGADEGLRSAQAPVDV